LKAAAPALASLLGPHGTGAGASSSTGLAAQLVTDAMLHILASRGHATPSSR
jgi:hypothetical protein